MGANGKQPTQTVLQMGQLHFEGNIIPHTWYQHLTKTVRRKSTKHETKEVETPYIEAIIILSDICYWYRPKYVRDEQTNRLIRLERRFAGDKLQRSYQQLADFFGFGKDQVRRAVKYLESKGLITVDLETISVRGVALSNVMFVEPVPEEIAKINLPIGTLSDVHSTPPPMDKGDGPGCTSETYTETSLEISSNEEDEKLFFGEDGKPKREPFEVSLPETDNPTVLGAHCAGVQAEEGTWTVTPEAGGADGYEGKPLQGFCALASVQPDDLPAKQRRAWVKQLHKIGDDWEASPDLVYEAIKALPHSEDYHWVNPTKPGSSTFQEAIGVLITRIKANGGANMTQQPTVVVFPEPEYLMIPGQPNVTRGKLKAAFEKKNREREKALAEMAASS